MRTSPFSLLASLALAACSQGAQQPCSDGGCLAVAGSYTFRLGEQANCAVWEKSVPPASLMQVTQGSDPSQLTLTLWPVTDDPHTLAGTLFSDGTINVTENQNSTLLGIPFAYITGSFTSNAGVGGGAPFYFGGQIFLEGGSQSQTAGQAGGPGQSGGLGCTGGTTFTAEENTAGAGTDGGTPVPDGGDAGV
ncbi:MAG: hypothetical protein ACYDCL_09505 [Myxococcales bacterium]